MNLVHQWKEIIHENENGSVYDKIIIFKLSVAQWIYESWNLIIFMSSHIKKIHLWAFGKAVEYTG